jgi:hypothetical protein
MTLTAQYRIGDPIRLKESGRRVYVYGLKYEDSTIVLVEHNGRKYEYGPDEIESAPKDEALGDELARAKEGAHDAARQLADEIVQRWGYSGFRRRFLAAFTTEEGSAVGTEITELIKNAGEHNALWRRAGQDLHDAIVAGRLP